MSAFAAFSINTMIAETREYVLQKGFVLSDLKWPLTPSLSYSIHCGFYFPKGIHIEGNITFIQPTRTGNMTDTDFFNIALSPPRFGLTHFSEHTCNIIEGIRASAKLGLQLPLPETPFMRKAGITIMVEPLISFVYSKISWYSYDGYSQYAKIKHNKTHEVWDKSIPKVFFQGPAIAYKQQLIIPAIGVGFDASFPHNIRLSTDFHVTADVIANSEDIHYRRKVRYIDIMNRGWAIHGGTRFTWQFIPYCALFFNFLYEKTITMEGRTLVYNTLDSVIPSDYLQQGSSGTSLSGCAFSAGIAFMLWR